jgi:hypothetical protein
VKAPAKSLSVVMLSSSVCMSNHTSLLQTELHLPHNLNFLAPTISDDLIRLGRPNDGGYIVPQRIVLETECLVSLGISDDWSFDSHFLMLKRDLMIHAYDHTISANIFVGRVRESFVKLFSRPSSLREFIIRLYVWISYKTFFCGKVKHFKERICNRRIHTSDADMNSIFDRISSGRVFIKMDLEGTEYALIEDLLAYSAKIVGMVIEFHDTNSLRQAFDGAVRKLQCYYEIVHVHGNNYAPVSADGLPDVLELTLVRKEFCRHTDKRAKLFIEGLDRPNDPRKADYILTFSCNT